MRMQVLHCFGLSGFWQGVLYSALAAGLAALLTTPFDVLGSRIMTQLRSQICPGPRHYHPPKKIQQPAASETRLQAQPARGGLHLDCVISAVCVLF